MKVQHIELFFTLLRKIGILNNTCKKCFEEREEKDTMVELLKFEDFDQMYSIMEQSFPYDEYRGYEGQKQLFENPEYKVFIHRNEETKEIDGFLSAWEFDDILFFEHFAVSSKVRNGGIGGRMLREVLTQVNKMTCLEVELPEGELEKRRISFYERNGFCYNPYPYTQPSIAPGREPIPLRIMTYQRTITETEYEKIKNLLYRRVYHVSEQQMK